MKLFHFSDDPAIALFVPRPVLVPSRRPEGRDWLNGPLVWAIDEAHEFLYLFPRDCPRILVWAKAESTEEDRRQWLGESRVVAFVEAAWLERLTMARLHRYELAPESFESLDDAGMWVSRQTVAVRGRTDIADPIAALAQRGVDLRVVETLAPMKPLWETSLHASGIRLRNSATWPKG